MKELDSLPFNQIRLVSNDANKMWLMWKNLFLSTLDKHTPITSMRLRDNKAPYITSELKSQIRQRYYLTTKANETGSKHFYQAFLNIRNQAKRLLYKLRQNYYSQRVEECKGDMRATWKALKHAIKQPCKSSNIRKIQHMGSEIPDTKMIAEMCNEHFVTIGKKLADETVQTGDSSPYAHLKRADTQFKFKPVTADQILIADYIQVHK